jgi:H+/Cl- antiporter ClcA
MSRELQQQALSAACALGVSSSLGAPLGGVLFAIEVTSSFYHFSSRFWKCFFVAVVGRVDTIVFSHVKFAFDRIYS